jgi:AraC family transcriptional regulator
LADHSLQIWDGIRQRLRRDVVSRRQTRIGQLEITSATENLIKATDWTFQEDHHTIVIHLDGRLDRLDCEFSVGPSGGAIPTRGDIWMIPAGCRYAALAQGERAQFVEFAVPTALTADAPLVPRVRYRDELLFGGAARLAELIARPDDDLAVMAAHAIVHAMEIHLLDCYGRRRTKEERRSLSVSDRARLVDAIRSEPGGRHSLSTLAGLVDMDIRRFTSAFQETFGQTPWQYVLRVRLDQAAELLRQTNRPITDIALAVGFATPSHFATAFLRRCGVTPSRYREFTQQSDRLSHIKRSLDGLFKTET